MSIELEQIDVLLRACNSLSCCFALSLISIARLHYCWSFMASKHSTREVMHLDIT